MRCLLVAAVLWSASSVGWSQGVLVMESKAAGTYYYEITVRADGTITAREIRNVVPVGEGGPRPNPPPNPPGDPNPPPKPPPDPPAPSLADFVLVQASKVQDPDREKTAKAIALIYSSVASLGQANRITSPQQMRGGTDTLYNIAMAEVGKRTVWAEWKFAVDAKVRNIQTVPEMVTAWKEIVTGLRRVD